MINFILEYWIQVLFGILTSLVAYLVTRIKKWTKEQDEVKDGVLALLHDRLYESGCYHIAREEISVDGMKNYEYLYKSYHSLGGNGTGTEIYNRVTNLPLKEKEC